MTQWPDGSLLSTLPGEAANSLLRMGTGLRFARGHVLIREGDKTTHVIVLRHGFVKVTADLENGREALMSIRAGAMWSANYRRLTADRARQR